MEAYTLVPLAIGYRLSKNERINFGLRVKRPNPESVS